ncbi:MAG TPA: hypothetical protein VKT52_09870 [Ktedonobacterales bacterium]|nr:hypothetical protein [Ktedonobacterales bacterium]
MSEWPEIKRPHDTSKAPSLSGMTCEEAVAKMLHTPPPPEKQAKKAAKKERAKQRKSQAGSTR